MDREETKQKLKGYLTHYLSKYKGINCNDYFPCLNPNHQNSGMSMHFNPKDNTVHCYGCGCTYDIFSLIGLDFNLPHYQDQLNKAGELFLENNKINTPKITRNEISKMSDGGTKIVDYTSFFRVCAKQAKSTDYFKEAGITDETIVKFNLGYEPEFSIGNNQQIKAMIIPNGPYGFWAINTETDPDEDYVFYYGKESLFCSYVNENTDDIFITDSIIDTLYMSQNGVCSIVIANEIHLNEFVYFLSQQVKKRNYYVTSQTENRLTGLIIRELINYEQPNQLIDLAYPAQSIGDLIMASPEKFRDRVKNIKKLLSVTPRKLLARKNYDLVSDDASFSEIYYSKGVYGISTDVITKRKLLSNWIMDSSADTDFIYHTCMAEWNILSVELDARTTDISKSYYSLLPKIGLSENTGNPEHDAGNLLTIFASKKIRRQEGSVLVINLQNCNAEYIRTFVNKLMSELRNYIHSIIFFCLDENRTLVDEFCWQTFTVRKDIASEENEDDDFDSHDYKVTASNAVSGKMFFYTVLE